MNRERLQHAFRHFDKDGSGKISLEELKETLGGGEEGNDHIFINMLAEADTNGDGEIDLEEFTNLMISKADSKKQSVTKNRV